VVDDATGDTIFAPYTVKDYQGVKVAFIGMTLEGTPTIVTPSGVGGLTFNDEVETVNALIPDITAQLDDAVDIVIADHTNDEFVCEVEGKWVTMADNCGRLFTDMDVTLNRVTKDMTVKAINNVPNLQAGVTPDPIVTALIDKYDALSAPLANGVIGSTTADILRASNAAGESAMGDVIADVQLDATDDPGFGDAVVAFMNPGGIRDDMIFAEVPGGEAPGEVTFGEAFSVQPFGNSLVTMTLTGDQIYELLTEQWVGQTSPRILQPSNGFTYTWDAGLTVADADRVVAGSVAIGGVAIVGTTNYRVTVNSFLADGGDNFATLVDGTNRLGGEVDLDALVTYFGANSPVAPGPQDRITRLS
jgi:5'-nucleotidase